MEYESHRFQSTTGILIRMFAPKNYRVELLNGRFIRMTKAGAVPSTSQVGNLFFKVDKNEPASPLDLQSPTVGLGEKFVRLTEQPMRKIGRPEDPLVHVSLARTVTQELTLIFYPYAIYVHADRSRDGLYPMTILQSDDKKRFRYESDLTTADRIKYDAELLRVSESLMKGTSKTVGYDFLAVQQKRITEAEKKIQELQDIIEEAGTQEEQVRIF